MDDIEEVFKFASTGRLGLLAVDMSVHEVLRLMGMPDGITGELPAIYVYDDLQLGISGDGILWYLAVEPSGSAMVVPSPIGSGSEGITPSMSEFMNYLHSQGEDAVRCEPFAAGEFWWRIPSSGVLLSFDDECILTAAHYSDTSLA